MAWLAGAAVALLVLGRCEESYAETEPLAQPRRRKFGIRVKYARACAVNNQ